MKYLKRINEDVENTIDMEYIDNCFIEFADQGRYQSYIFVNGDQLTIEIDIPSEYTIASDDGSITYVFSKHKWKLNEYAEIENCLQKVKIKQPFLFYNLHDEEDNDGKIVINLSKEKKQHHTI
jgi:hypothetical protein